MKNDIRLEHTCRLHVDPDQNSFKGIIYPGMKHFRYQFVAECPRCHKRVIVKCTTKKNAEEVMAKFPVLVRFPK